MNDFECFIKVLANNQSNEYFLRLIRVFTCIIKLCEYGDECTGQLISYKGNITSIKNNCF